MQPTGLSSRAKRFALLAVAFQLTFLVLHFLYDWFPSPVAAIVSGVDESVFQHMKVGFYTWLLVALGEGLVTRPSRVLDFAASRLIGSIAAPLGFVVVWFMAAAVAGPMPNDAAEIAWANLAVLAGGLFGFFLEDHMDQAPMHPALRAFAFGLAALAAFQFTRYTFELPWVDIFENPARP